jgi:tRNA(Ile)-lysidine synthase
MLREFISYIEENRLYGSEGRILMAVSGGIDSMVMSHLFIAAGIPAAVAHCNFSLRGKESDLDEAFVRKFAAKHKIPFHTVKFDTTRYAAEKGISIQMAARELRYRWFEEVRSENGYQSVALAHNLNDNVETFLINLTRGTGIAGLTGMRPRFKNLVRPLLFASRKAITEYSDQNRIKFREDRSNSDVKYTRNKLRHNIIPLFRELNPSFDTTVTETAERLGEINDIVTEYILETRNKVRSHHNEMVSFNAPELKSLIDKRTVLFELFRPYGLSSVQVDELIKLIKSRSGKKLLTRSHVITRNRNEILVSLADKSTEYRYEAPSIGSLQKVPGIISAKIKSKGSRFRIPSSSSVACLDAGKLDYPLIVRKWLPGDHFYPLGMRSGKKLSDHFIDRKYSIPQKENQLILESSGRIAWIIGDRIDDRFKVTETTKKVAVIRYDSGYRGQ